MLELGCGDGANVLSLAQALPGASFLGIDAAPSALARGAELARAAGLQNVELRHGLIEDLPADLGRFDYILAHGVYSWIAPAARGALLDCCRGRLNPAGIAYVSYNAYPGSHLRDMTRDILHYHVRDLDEPRARLQRAQELMRTIVAIESPSPYAQALREQLERMLRSGDALLLHDDLAEISTPFYFHEFMEHAASHGLGFLSEAELSDSQMRDVPESAGRLMASLGDDAIAREQYMDFFRNRTFRRTLLCHARAPVRRELDDGVLERLAISSPARPVERDTEEGVRMRPSPPPRVSRSPPPSRWSGPRCARSRGPGRRRSPSRSCSRSRATPPAPRLGSSWSAGACARCCCRRTSRGSCSCRAARHPSPRAPASGHWRAPWRAPSAPPERGS